MAPALEAYRFGRFTLDVSAYELRCDGRPVRLERRPMDLLILLVERRGQLVTRADIAGRLWGDNVFVDVENSVNTVVWKLRAALRDSSGVPAYVETVPAKGYRFIAAVDVVARSGDAAVAPPFALDHTPTTPHATAAAGSVPGAIRFRRWHQLAVPVAIAATVVLAFASWRRTADGDPASVTLAVLQFENIGGDPDLDYLADGLTAETIASLGQVDAERFSVIGRTSAGVSRFRDLPHAAVGRELGAAYLVEGSVQKTGPAVQVTVTLTRAADQLQLWSASYDRELATLTGLPREISATIAAQMQRRLPSGVASDISRRHPADAAAYEAYLRGRFFENRRNRESTVRAIQYYEQAIALQPDYALAWSNLAFTQAARALNSDANPLDVWPKAREAAATAVRSDPNLPESQFAMGYVHWLLNWDWPAAEAAFRRAIALDPSNVVPIRTLGHLLSQRGRHQEARELMRRTRELEPLAAMSHVLSSQVAFQGRRTADAIAHAKQAVLVDSRLWIGYAQLAQGYMHVGEADLALEALADAARFAGGETSQTLSIRGYLLATLGRTTEARAVLYTIEAVSRERYVPPYALALVYAGLRDREAAFEWLEKAYATRDVNLIFLPVDQKWDPYRADPAFQALVERSGFTR